MEPEHPTRPLPHFAPWRRKLHDLVFEADTPKGKLFDIILLVFIAFSVLVVMLDSMASVSDKYHDELLAAEWAFTILFSIEYILRILSTRKPLSYITSFYGIIDLLSIIPTYLTLFIPADSARSLLVIRALRLLRIFRVFKLVHFLSEANALRKAFYSSRAKIAVFLAIVVILVVVVGSAMYVIEGQVNGNQFTSIPQSIYWAIVTMTTVGYGDISPVTALGKAVAAMIMLIGYSLIIVPTSIVSAEMIASARKASTRVCPDCCMEGHEDDAKHCKYCGAPL